MFGRNSRVFAVVGIVAIGMLLAAFLTTQVQNKPWGVSDLQRQQYDATIRRLTLANSVVSGENTIDVPALKVSKTKATVDGVVSGERIEHAFQITNEGSDTLTLEVDVDQFAEEPEVDLEWELSDRRVQPMSTTTLRMAWNADQVEANQRRQLRLKTNDPLQPKVLFAVVATVSRPLLTPDVVSVGKVDKGESFTAVLSIASETTEELGVLGIECGLTKFDWTVMPIAGRSRPPEFAKAKHLTQVMIQGTKEEFGSFEEQAELQLLFNGEPIKRTFNISGIVKAPITFIHPEMHQSDGLSIGTVSSKEDVEVSVAVRHRGEPSRRLEVLDFEPKFLDVSIEPGELGFQSSRLVIRIPKNTPTQSFDREGHHGYVHIGDPSEEGFSGWFSLYGAVAKDF